MSRIFTKMVLLAVMFLSPIKSLLEGLYPTVSPSHIQLLYADSDIMVFNKPANLNTAPGFLDSNSLATYAGELFRIPRVDKTIVHRLDYATSGVVIFARDIEALTLLHKDFRLKTNVRKTYVALVHGCPMTSEGEIDLPIGRDSTRGSPLHCVDTLQGKSSLTYWKVIERSKEFAMLSLRPVTGRTHQLRIHLHAIGYPIVGDRFYYTPESLCLDNNHSVSRLHLHAESLIIRHPRTKQEMIFSAKRPFTLS